jgi:NTP pyrophosphatase (non-canonical NTP hydrolase)
MDARTYQIEAQRSAAPIENLSTEIPLEAQQKVRLLLSTVGISGESGEALDIISSALYEYVLFDNILFQKELGDVSWYCAHACDTLGLQLEDLMTSDKEARFIADAAPDNKHNRLDVIMATTSKLCIHASRFSEHTKKFIYHAHDFDIELFKCELQKILKYFSVLCMLTGASPGDIWDINIKKLRARYPNKFETTLSINKDENNE